MASAGRSRRVLIIVENLPSPFDRRVWQEATTLQEAGYEVSIICPTGKGYEKKYEVMAIVSGPEPQRSLFEELQLAQLIDLGKPCLLVQGKPEESEHRSEGNVEIYSHLKSRELRDAILASGMIICRPGYSSIMDLSVLGKQAIFVPTPGQTEQEYLAAYHKQKHHYYSIPQDQFVLNKSIQAARNYSGIKLDYSKDIMDAKVDELLSRL